jgi:hypothetical protein
MSDKPWCDGCTERGITNSRLDLCPIQNDWVHIKKLGLDEFVESIIRQIGCNSRRSK